MKTAEYFEAKAINIVEGKKDILATKEDIAKLRIEIAENKSEMIKWMFIFWVTQLAGMFAFLKYFVH